LVTIHYEAAPVAVLKKTSSVEFQIRFNPEFDETVQVRRDLRAFNKPVDDSIFPHYEKTLNSPHEAR